MFRGRSTPRGPESDQRVDRAWPGSRDGAAVAYRGRVVKHAVPVATDYVHLAPGGSYASTVDLAGDYDLSRPGSYTVRLGSDRVRLRAGVLSGGSSEPALTEVPVRGSSARFRSSAGVAASAVAAAARRAAASAPVSTATVQVAGVTLVFRSCSSARQGVLKQAVSDAAAYSAHASTWLSGHPSGGGTYGTWFGRYSPSRFSRVSGAFSGISAELTGRTVTLDCSSTAPYMAYVYPDDAYTIYLCPGYWPAPARGYDSRAGTLVHESSHFTVNGGADDVVYGIDEGIQLAGTHPDDAVRNADNIEHFAESL